MSECENCRKLEKRISELEKRLAAYENAHTPYSRKVFKPRPNAAGKKRGRPSGLPGTTRPKPEPDRTIESAYKKCPKCKKGELVWLGKDERFVEEIPEPPPVKVTKYVNNIYLCKCCGKEVTAIHKDCPDEGRFGINVLAETAIMKFEERMTPTNNTAERALREHVVIRKIIGGLRSQAGARVHEVIMSCFATWKLAGLNLFSTLVSFLRGS